MLQRCRTEGHAVIARQTTYQCVCLNQALQMTPTAE